MLNFRWIRMIDKYREAYTSMTRIYLITSMNDDGGSIFNAQCFFVNFIHNRHPSVSNDDSHIISYIRAYWNVWSMKLKEIGSTDFLFGLLAKSVESVEVISNQ